MQVSYTLHDTTPFHFCLKHFQCTQLAYMYNFFYTKFYPQKSEWDWATGIAYFSTLPTARSRLYTLYKYTYNSTNFIEKRRKTGKKEGKNYRLVPVWKY